MQIAVASTVQEKKSLRSNLITISSYKHDNKIRLKIFTELFFDIDEAYRLLNVTFDKEDDWILTMYNLILMKMICQGPAITLEHCLLLVIKEEVSVL